MKKLSMKKHSVFFLLFAALVFLLAPGNAAASETNKLPETKHLRIIGTSDLHGKFLPWDYALDEESLSGSMAQLSTALSEYRSTGTTTRFW